jgi:hypothetical protein
VALARHKRVRERGSRRRLITGQIPRQNKPERSLRGWPVEWDLERFAVGHRLPHSRTGVRVPNCRPLVVPLSRINTGLSPVQM